MGVRELLAEEAPDAFGLLRLRRRDAPALHTPEGNEQEGRIVRTGLHVIPAISSPYSTLGSFMSVTSDPRYESLPGISDPYARYLSGISLPSAARR